MELRAAGTHHSGTTKTTLRQQWQHFKTGRPGRRFKDRHAAHRRKKNPPFGFSRILVWLGALLSLAIGMILVFIPGPAVLFFLLTGALLATESQVIATFMDWAEVKTRAVVKGLQRWWKHRSPGGKAVALTMMGGMGAGLAYASFRLFISG